MDATDLLLPVVLGALVGAVGGGLGPAALRRLPEPAPDPELAAAEADDPRALRHPPKVPYTELAARHGLAVRLGVVAAVVCALLAGAIGLEPELPAYLLAGVVGTWLAWVDVQVHLLPDRLNGPLFLGCVVLLGVAAVVTGDVGSFVRAGIGALALLAFYLLLALVRPTDMGLGDVKLAAVLGLLLAWVGWGTLVVGAFLGFLLGGLGGLVMLVVQRRSLRSAIPFGPYMLVGALLGVIVGEWVSAAYVGGL